MALHFPRCAEKLRLSFPGWQGGRLGPMGLLSFLTTPEENNKRMANLAFIVYLLLPLSFIDRSLTKSLQVHLRMDLAAVAGKT